MAQRIRTGLWALAIVAGMTVALGVFYVNADDAGAASALARRVGSVGVTLALVGFAMGRLMQHRDGSDGIAAEDLADSPRSTSRVWVPAVSFVIGVVVGATAVGVSRDTPTAPRTTSAPAVQPMAASRVATEAAHEASFPESPRPTASEVFALRSKCAELGQKLLDAAVSPAFTRWQRLRYDQASNRCYVKLFFHSTDYDRAELYDGQSRELIAWTQKEPGVLIGGTIEGEKHDSYDEAVATMNRYVGDGR